MEKLPPVTGVPTLGDVRSSAEMMLSSKDDLSPARQAGLLLRALAIHMEYAIARQNTLAADLEKIKAHLGIQ